VVRIRDTAYILLMILVAYVLHIRRLVILFLPKLKVFYQKQNKTQSIKSIEVKKI
jgi:hypothetical protein